MKNRNPNSAIISKYIHTKTHNPHSFLTPASYLTPIQTDMDIFPYDRFFRGMTDCTRPRVFDREAGHRRWNQSGAYSYQFNPDLVLPRKFEGCFQIPCSTILPCINVETSYKRPIDFCVNISP